MRTGTGTVCDDLSGMRSGKDPGKRDWVGRDTGNGCWEGEGEGEGVWAPRGWGGRTGAGPDLRAEMAATRGDERLLRQAAGGRGGAVMGDSNRLRRMREGSEREGWEGGRGLASSGGGGDSGGDLLEEVSPAFLGDVGVGEDGPGCRNNNNKIK